MRASEAVQIRVLVADVVGAGLEWMVELIKKQEDMILAGQIQDRVELMPGIAEAMDDGKAIDVLVLSAPRVHPPPGLCSHLLGEFPYLKILVVSATTHTISPAASRVRRAATVKRTAKKAQVYWMGLRQSKPRALADDGITAAMIRRAFTLGPISLDAATPRTLAAP